jgi:ribosomal protein L30E
VGNGKVLNRAFKRVVTTADPERIRADIVSGIDARIGDLLSIGRRAGKTVSGIDTLLRKSARLGLLILASDIAEDSKRKLAQAVRNHDCLVVEYSDASGLGRTQGQEHRVAIGVKDSEMAARLVIEFERRRRVLVAT